MYIVMVRKFLSANVTFIFAAIIKHYVSFDVIFILRLSQSDI